MEPFIGQIIMFAGNFAPRGWAFCDGQLIPITQNTALFSILGTTYGGDGRTTFALPDLRGRVAMHAGSGPGLSSRRLGEKGGAENVKLTEAEMPSHSHLVLSSSTADPSNTGAFATGAANTSGSAPALPVTHTGGSLPHNNVQPFGCVNFIIALYGVFPSRG